MTTATQRVSNRGLSSFLDGTQRDDAAIHSYSACVKHLDAARLQCQRQNGSIIRIYDPTSRSRRIGGRGDLRIFIAEAERGDTRQVQPAGAVEIPTISANRPVVVAPELDVGIRCVQRRRKPRI